MVGRKIAIIGTSETKLLAPFDDSTWEFWGLNNLFLGLEDTKSFTRWFELHTFEQINKNKYIRRGVDHYGRLTIKDYMQEIAKLKIPVYMQEEWKIISKSKIFPFEQLMSFFKTKYFGCSIAWMLALALYEHLSGQLIKKIGFWGIELTGVEYYHQRATTERFIGYAEAKGIEIVIPEESSLLKMPYIYAYKEDFDLIKDLYGGSGRSMALWFLTCYQQLIEELYCGN